ncbi:hypothetical protein GE09DRAFT_135608 [Coniochaeta sp. 2T2.1]|nr:hypothetical protein GE09DRAFT_135608 [Coniochaeta sp. 2T2.1]
MRSPFGSIVELQLNPAEEAETLHFQSNKSAIDLGITLPEIYLLPYVHRSLAAPATSPVRVSVMTLEHSATPAHFAWFCKLQYTSMPGMQAVPFCKATPPIRPTSPEGLLPSSLITVTIDWEKCPERDLSRRADGRCDGDAISACARPSGRVDVGMSRAVARQSKAVLPVYGGRHLHNIAPPGMYPVIWRWSTRLSTPGPRTWASAGGK